MNCRADRKSTRLNSSHDQISYAVFCLKNKIQPLRLAVTKPGDVAAAAELASDVTLVINNAGIAQPGGFLFPYIFFFTDPATTEIYTLSLHDALPISRVDKIVGPGNAFVNEAKLVVSHDVARSEEHTSELQSRSDLVCRLLLEKKKKKKNLFFVIKKKKKKIKNKITHKKT